GVFVVSGCEDYRGIDLHLLEYLETDAVGELDVHEDQVGLTRLQPLHRFFHRVDTRQDLGARDQLTGQRLQPLRCVWFIFHNQDVHRGDLVNTGTFTTHAPASSCAVILLSVRSSYRLAMFSSPTPDEGSPITVFRCRLFLATM